MPPCKTSPAPTPLQLSLHSQPSLLRWLSGMEQARALLAKIGRDQNQHVAAAFDKINAAFHVLEEEGEVDSSALADDAMQALRGHFPDVYATVASMLANVDRMLGRERFQRIFSPGADNQRKR